MKRLLLRIGGVVLALFVLLVIANAIWIAVLKEEFEERVKGLRSAGKPVEMADLRTPEIPEEENAAPLLLAARELDEQLDSPYPYSIIDGEWTDENREDVGAYLKRSGEYFELLREAAARPSCRFDRHWQAGIEFVVDEMPIFQGATHAAELSVRNACLTGEGWSPALDALETNTRLAEFADSRILICQLARAFVLEQVCTQLERLASRTEVDAQALDDRFSPLLKVAERPERWHEFLDGERAFGLSVVHDWLEGESPLRLSVTRLLTDPDFGDRAKDALLGSWFARGFAYRDGLLCLDFYDEIRSVYRPGDPTARVELEAVSEVRRSIRCSLIDHFTPLFSRANEQSVIEAAHLRLARVGLALAAHHSEYGEWPDSLDGLPLDPYTNVPFVYERTETGVAIEAQRPIGTTDPDVREEMRIVWRLNR